MRSRRGYMPFKLTSSTGCCSLEGMGDCRILGRSVHLVVGLIPEASTVRLYIRVTFGSKASMSSLVPISREFRSSTLYCASDWGGKANSAGLHVKKKKNTPAGGGPPHTPRTRAITWCFCINSLQVGFGLAIYIGPSYTGFKYRTGMYSPSYDLLREILPVREEADRRPYGTMHALRSMGGGASRYGKRGERESEGREAQY
jgi:hypothetical protein